MHRGAWVRSWYGPGWLLVGFPLSQMPGFWAQRSLAFFEMRCSARGSVSSLCISFAPLCACIRAVASCPLLSRCRRLASTSHPSQESSSSQLCFCRGAFDPQDLHPWCCLLFHGEAEAARSRGRCAEWCHGRAGCRGGPAGDQGGSEGREQTWLWVLASPQTPGPWRVAVLEGPADQK